MNAFSHTRAWRREVDKIRNFGWGDALDALCLAYERDNPFHAPERYKPSLYVSRISDDTIWDFGDAELHAVYEAGGYASLAECANARKIESTTICAQCGTRHTADGRSPYMSARWNDFWHKIAAWIDANDSFFLERILQRETQVLAATRVAASMRAAEKAERNSADVPACVRHLFTDTACWMCGQYGASWQQAAIFYPMTTNCDVYSRDLPIWTCESVLRIDFDTLGLMRVCSNCFYEVDSLISKVVEFHDYVAAALPNAAGRKSAKHVPRFAKAQTANK